MFHCFIVKQEGSMKFFQPFTREILDSLSEGVFIVDKYFRIRFFNRAAEEITGWSREEVEGRLCNQIFYSHNCQDFCPLRAVLEKKQPVRSRMCSIQHKNGYELKIRANANVFWEDSPEPQGGIVSFQNLSELEAIHHHLMQQSDYHGIIGVSKAMREIFGLIEDISDSDATVLIQGESGTGKEMIANAIQATSLRRNKPFIKVNCSVFSPQLLASELFGHVKGAFTGAIKDRPGRFEMADGGTLFLDEVGEMSLEMQLQLLRVLQEGTFERVGESITRRVDVRVIAATNQNLEEALREGRFRQDLYYRLNVIPIHVPPLRERREDIPPLIAHFLKKFAFLYKKEITEIDDSAMEALLKYHWPGNVRELENALEYAFARTRSGEVIRVCKLPPHVREEVECFLNNQQESSSQEPADEMARILQLLNQYQWNRSKVARKLGIGRTTLWRKMRRYGLLRNEQ